MDTQCSIHTHSDTNTHHLRFYRKCNFDRSSSFASPVFVPSSEEYLCTNAHCSIMLLVGMRASLCTAAAVHAPVPIWSMKFRASAASLWCRNYRAYWCVCAFTKYWPTQKIHKPYYHATKYKYNFAGIVQPLNAYIAIAFMLGIIQTEYYTQIRSAPTHSVSVLSMKQKQPWTTCVIA